MDLLDLIDADEYHEKKSNRVRSWYLYEQYKSLERNQLDATQKLKNRSYQDSILRQEIDERRSRRQLYDPDQACVDDVNGTASECNKSLSVHSEDFFESFCEFQEDSEEDPFFSQDSWIAKSDSDELKSLDLENIHDNSCSESVNSVIDNYKSNEVLASDLEAKLKLFERNSPDDNDQQNALENENFLANYDSDKDGEVSECGSICHLKENNAKIVGRRRSHTDITIYNFWSKLVSFSYQVISLHHGNCYNDYGSQLLTAVLAFDVLRRGVSKMCDILQPYVSPVKFTDDPEDSTTSYKSAKRKTQFLLQTQKNSKNSKAHSCGVSSKPKLGGLGLAGSENYWRKYSKYSFGKKLKAKDRASEPCRSVRPLSNIDPSEKYSGSTWPSIPRGSSRLPGCNCPCHVKVTNPMLKIGRYIDTLLKDIEYY